MHSDQPQAINHIKNPGAGRADELTHVISLSILWPSRPSNQETRSFFEMYRNC